jgi:putative intracellular protease/amidase
MKILKNFFVSSSVMMASVFAQDITKAEDITYDWLVKYGDESGATDYIPHIRRIFKKYQPKILMEFGLGYATKYFLDHCDKVISFEFVTGGYGPEGMSKFLNLYRGYSNWIPIAYFTGYRGDYSFAPYKYVGTDALFLASSFQCTTKLHYTEVNDFYLKEFDSLLTNMFKAHTIEMALINPGGMYVRGDIVELLFGTVPIILAHDTNFRAPQDLDDIYGYSRIGTPDDYEEIFFPGGQGTTAWVKKEERFEELIRDLKKYAKGL